MALSGYSNELYDAQPWDERYEWDSFVSIQSISYNGNKSRLEGLEKRASAKEVLWIKS